MRAYLLITTATTIFGGDDGTRTCQKCGGTGRYMIGKCFTCNGTGRVPDKGN